MREFVSPAEYLLAVTAQCRATGICPTCRYRPAKKGCKTCEVCLKKAADRRRGWRAKRLCVDCRKKSKTRRCRKCQQEHQAARENR